MIKKLCKRSSGGYVVMVLAIIFAALGLVLVIGGAVPVVSHYSSTQGYSYSKQALLASDSGINEAVYRLKMGMNLPNLVSVSLNTGSSTINTTAVPGGKTVAVAGNYKNYERKFEADLVYGSGIAFNYGLQAGNGGMTIDGGSTIIGNVYSNGNVDAISTTITGTVVAADTYAMTTDQLNSSPSTPPSSINFRNASASQDFAQSFTIGTSTALNKIQVYIKKTGSPANATVRLVNDNAGSPSTTEIPTGGISLVATSVGTSYGWVDLVFTTKPALVPGTTYWLVIDSGSQNVNNYFTIGANNTYSGGAAKTGSYGGSWTVTNLDGYFMVYVGGITSTIGRAAYPTGLMVGDNNEGDAWATTVKGTTAEGTIYCTTGTNNNQSCDTSRGSPPPVDMPLTDENIATWKAEAETGGVTNGNVNVGWQGLTLGPRKITGNLSVSGGGVLTINGTIWVQGTITVSGGGSILLNSGENSTPLLSDSRISITGGGTVSSGSNDSYLFLVSTSKCPNDINCGGQPAIIISGGGGAIAANAQSGTVTLNGGGAINAITANYIVISGGGEVTYEEGLASPSFTSGPSGGFHINSWREK